MDKGELEMNDFLNGVLVGYFIGVIIVSIILLLIGKWLRKKGFKYIYLYMMVV